MRPPGRPKGEYRNAQHEGTPVRPPGRPKGDDRNAQHEGTPVTSLLEDVARAFAKGGALDQADPHYVEREVQQRMARDVAIAIDGRTALVAEAGTGVGKTFAYLVPTLLSGKRALISTATKSLQDQLFLRDLPRLRDALRVPITLALLKGRASYLCHHRLHQ